MTLPTIKTVFGPHTEGEPDAQDRRGVGQCARTNEATFFRSLRMPNGTFKTTSANRLNDLNALVCGYLDRNNEIRLLDVGVSSGVSTYEWYRCLEDNNFSFTLTGSDLLIHVSRITIAPCIDLLITPDWHLLQIDLFSSAFPNSSGNRWKNAFYLSAAATTKVVLSLSAGLRIAVANRVPFARFGPLITVRTQSLLDSRLLAVPAIELKEEDLLYPEYGDDGPAFDCIRAANVLNSEYFSEPELRRMADGLKRRLCNGGLLVVCKTEKNGKNNATVFRKVEGGQLEAVARLGSGAPNEDTIG